jgi:hypothetical protein
MLTFAQFFSDLPALHEDRNSVKDSQTRKKLAGQCLWSINFSA